MTSDPFPESPQPKITRLPRNGPKPGQSADSWLYGKKKAFEQLVDNPRTKFKQPPFSRP